MQLNDKHHHIMIHAMQEIRQRTHRKLNQDECEAFQDFKKENPVWRKTLEFHLVEK